MKKKKNRAVTKNKKITRKCVDGGNKRSKSTNEIVIPEYYQLVWAKIHEDFYEEIYSKYVVNPKAFRRSTVFRLREIFTKEDSSNQYQALMDILNNIEIELESTIKRHSAFFWIHIYRRIAPSLHEDLGNNTDENVVVTVRNYAEQAILKYGSLTYSDDYALSTMVEFDKILGGLLGEYFRDSYSKEQIALYEKYLKKKPQWVLTDFTNVDIQDLYYIEGLSYQYWYISAKMRSLGKGISLEVSKENDLIENRTKDQDYLITNFDKRNEENGIQLGIVSNVGTYTRSIKGSHHQIILNAFINASLHTAGDLGLKGLPEDFSPNYIPWYINTDSFYKSHIYLSDKFEQEFGFGLLEFLQVAVLLSNIILFSHPSGASKNTGISLLYYQKFQRGYTIFPSSLIDIKSSILKYASILRKDNRIHESKIESQLDSILEHITLDKNKQKNIGIWSNGPKYILIDIGRGYLCDISSWHALLRNMFFGLRNYDPTSKKGIEFESTFSDMLKASGFDIELQSKVIHCGRKKREIDVAVRISDNLYLFECRASERPLNFDIGHPSTINRRSNDLKKKVEQSDSLEKFIQENRVGDNYDFSWAQSIDSFVVSPYTEWIWSKDQSLWTKCGKFPRIMSINDVIQYLKNEAKAT